MADSAQYSNLVAVWRAVSVKAVIFDMDGVIVDSESWHERVFLEVVRELGYENVGLRFVDYIG